MASVFLSYNRESAAIARDLADDVEALGHTVWFDQELSGGQAWWDQILATIRACDVFVFLLDRESLNSTACKREYGYAADLGKPILPVLVSRDVSPRLLPPALSQIHYVDYTERTREAAFRLARALTALPDPEPLPDPLPSPPDAPVSYLGSLTEQVGTSTLSFQEQSALLVDLKRSFRDPATREDTWTLLERLRRRRDLFATIAEEIDLLLSVPESDLTERQAEVDVEPQAGDGDEHIRLGLEAFEEGKYAESVKEFELALSQRVTSYPMEQVYTMLGNAYTNSDLLDKALAAHKKAIEINPDFHKAWANIGIVHRLTGDFDEAERCYEKAVSIQPDYAEVHASLGALHIFRGDQKKALQALEKAIDLNPQMPIAHSNMALALAQEGRFDEAYGSLKKAVSMGYRNGSIVRERIDNLKSLAE